MLAKSIGLVLPGYTLIDPPRPLPQYYPDAVIDSESVFCIDSLDPSSWPSQANATAGASFVNLVEGGGNANFTHDMTFVDRQGFLFGLSLGRRIELPDTAKLTGYNGGFVFALWMNRDSQTQINSPVAGWFSGAVGAERGYGIRFSSGTTYTMVVGDKRQNGAGKQVVMARCSDGDDGWLAAFFINGALVGTQEMGDFVQPVAPPAKAALGDVESGNLGYWIGRIGRSWMTKKTYTVDQLTALVEKDWVLNSTRYD